MAYTVSSSSVVAAAKDKVFSEIEGEVVVLDLESGTYYGLDSVGARVWHLIQEPQTVTAVRDALLDEFEVDLGRCEKDLTALVQEMAAAGLVEVWDETAV